MSAVWKPICCGSHKMIRVFDRDLPARKASPPATWIGCTTKLATSSSWLLLNWLPGGKRWKRQALRQAQVGGKCQSPSGGIFVASSLFPGGFYTSVLHTSRERWGWECFTCLHCWFMVIGLVISSSQCLHLLRVTTTNFLLIYEELCFLYRLLGCPELTLFEIIHRYMQGRRALENLRFVITFSPLINRGISHLFYPQIPAKPLNLTYT